MSAAPRIAVYGAGAFGTALGAVLARAGREVTLVGRDGTVGEQKRALVEVVAAAPGAACARDEGCISQRCVCSGVCPAPLASGLCLAECSQTTCPDQSLCVDLARGGAASSSAPWRTKVCMPSCQSDLDCKRPGFSCRLAPLSAGAGWRKVCLPPFPRFVGAPCRDNDGKPDDSACLGGRCLDLGAGGYCSAPCDSGACPDGTRCAKVTGLAETTCLLRCGPGLCAGDAHLACELPLATGYWGFSIVGPADPANTTYCAAKRCSSNNACGLGGRCDLAAGGFCRLE